MLIRAVRVHIIPEAVLPAAQPDRTEAARRAAQTAAEVQVPHRAETAAVSRDLQTAVPATAAAVMQEAHAERAQAAAEPQRLPFVS